MILNADCIRDILMVLEEQLVPDAFGNVSPIDPADLVKVPKLAKYNVDSQGTVMYHVRQMFSSGLLVEGKLYIRMAVPYIDDISPKGHAFLNQIRKDSTFKKFVGFICDGLNLASIVKNILA